VEAIVEKYRQQRLYLTAVYAEDKAGSAGSENFDRTRHVATLSFVQSDGQPWPVPWRHAAPQTTFS